MLTQAPKGTKDLLPQDSYRWQAVEAMEREFDVSREKSELLRRIVVEQSQLPPPSTEVGIKEACRAGIARFSALARSKLNNSTAIR